MSEEENIEERPEDAKSESPEENLGENISPLETIEQNETQIEKSLPDLPSRQAGEIPKSEIQNMEVHHHPHVEKKNFKEYLLEGLMIFLAVTLGFFAENIREHFSNNERVTQLSEQLVQELKKDTASLNKIIVEQTRLQMTADSIFKTLQHPLDSIDTKNLQRLVEKCFRITTFTSSSGALTSIKNQLNLKQFSSSGISNYITDYEIRQNEVKNSEAVQVQQVKEILQKFMQQHFSSDDMYALRIAHSDISGKLRKTSPDDLEDFRAAMISIEDFNTVLAISYNDSRESALKLMQYVRKEFDIEDK